MNRSLKIILVASLLGLGLTLTVSREVPRPLRAGWHALTGRPEAEDAASLDAFSSKVGERNAYDLRLDTQLSVPNDGQIYHFLVRGTWALTTLERKPKSTVVHARLVDAVVTTPDAASDASRLRVLGDEIGRELMLHYDLNGAVIKVQLDTKISQLAQGLVKGVVAYSQVVHPAGMKQAWTTQETDALGEYEARYVQRDAHGLDKTKTTYLRIVGASDPSLAAGVSITVKSSKLRADAKSDGGLASLTAYEQLDSKGGLIPEAVSTSKLTLASIESRSQPASVATLFARAHKLPGAPIDQVAKINGFASDADRERVGERKLPDMIKSLADYRQPPRKPGEENGDYLPQDKRNERDRLFIALGAELRLDDAAVDVVMNEIRNGSLDHAILRDALVSAGTEHAQSALIELMDFYENQTDRRMTLVGMSLLRQPSPETVDYLKTMFDDPIHGRQARYGMGSVIQSLNQVDADTVTEPLDLLQERFRTATNARDRADFANALGNTHLLDVRPEIDAALQDDSPEVRIAGVNGLTHQATEDVDGLIAKMMTSDPNVLVRDNAIDVAMRREPSATLLDAITQCMRLDPEILVRRSAISAAASMRTTVPQLDESLQWVAQNDPEPKLRDLAAAAL